MAVKPKDPFSAQSRSAGKPPEGLVESRANVAFQPGRKKETGTQKEKKKRERKGRP